jgi:hypothetical protein
MFNFLKFFFIFILCGVVWFIIFSIPVAESESIFVVLQKTLNTSPSDEDDSAIKKELNKEKIVDALTKAFKEK